MKLTNTDYAALSTIVSDLEDITDLVTELSLRIPTDIALNQLLDRYFDGDARLCANFIEHHSSVNTHIDAEISILASEVASMFGTSGKLDANAATEYVHDNFCLSEIYSDHNTEINVSDVCVRYTYTMKPCTEQRDAA
jgi:hypothetical protein